MIHRLVLTGLLALSATSNIWGHGFPLLLTESGGKLDFLNQVPVGEFFDDGFEIFTEDPAIGVNFEVTGPPTGTELMLEIEGGLLHWDGVEVAPTTSTLTIEAPEFDSLGNPNSPSVAEYFVDAQSASQTGMRWHTYPGGNFWDVHGFYTLSPGSAPGVYGVPLCIDSPTLLPTQIELLPFLFDPFDQFTLAEEDEGVAALRQLVVAPTLSGDYDLDGVVDTHDYQIWSASYGANVLIDGAGPDGNADSLINAADYTQWRDALSTASVTVPEPQALLIATAVFTSALFIRTHSV